MKKRSALSGIIVLLLLLFTFPLQAVAHDLAKVIHVTDGDTLKMLYKGKEERVRLIGIDAPESRVNPKARRDPGRSSEDLNSIIPYGGATRFGIKATMG